MIWLLLVASLAHGQSTATASVPLIDQIQISNLGKDTRDLLSGRYRQTGKPTFAGGFCFADGTCQTTAVKGAAFVQDISSATSASWPAAGTAIPSDDTKPQISEGWQVLVATITPTASTATIAISAYINYDESANLCNQGASCIYKGDGADPLVCVPIYTSGSPVYGIAVIYYTESAASTTQRNYSVRVGCEAANAVGVNRIANVTIYGGALTSSLRVVER